MWSSLLLFNFLFSTGTPLGHPQHKLHLSEDDEYGLFLDSEHRFRFSWSVDYERQEVDIRVDVRVDFDDQRWVAVGFSDYGSVSDADLCLLYLDEDRKLRMKDVWSDASGSVHVDRKQNCRLVEAEVEEEEGRVRWRYFRSFDTCDDEDYVIDEGTTHVVYALGTRPLHLSHAHTSTGFQRAQLLKIPTPQHPLPHDVTSFDVLNHKVRVPNEETTYWCHVVRLPNLSQPKHVIQFEAVIQEGHETLVHHMEVFHCEVRSGVKVPAYDGPCSAPTRPKDTQICKKVISAWAMGAQPFVYPEEAGLPIGGPEFSPYVMLEVHYNNPELRADYVDSSGIRLHYTGQLRRFDAAVLEVGLEYSDKMAIPPAQPWFPVSGHCIAECTQVALPVHGVTLFAAQLHTHLTGRRVFVKHLRGGVEMDEMARDNHYSPHFQEIRYLRRRTLLLPGDALVTTCVYDTSSRTNITLGGYAISDEMCVSYIHYFPKSNLEVCKSSIDSEVLDNYFRFQHEYEEQATSNERSVAENYRVIDWTPLKSLVLHRLYEEAPLSMQCNQSSGARFPGNWNNMAQAKPLRPKPEKQRSCG